MLRILVTGAEGFVGKNFQQFLKENYPAAECTFLTRSKIAKKPSFGKFVKADLLKKLPASLCSKKFDFVFHLAALNITNVGKVELHELLESNSFTTLRLLKELKFDNFVFLSTVKVYGTPVSGKVLDENAIPHPIDDYSISKYVAELFCQKALKNSKAKLFVFRSVNIYGPKQPAKALVPVFFSNAMQGKEMQLFGKESKVQLVFMNDVLEAFKLAIDKRLPEGVYHIAPQNPVLLSEIAEKVKRLCNSSSVVKIIDKDVQSSIVSSKKLESFGWKAKTGIDEGLKKVFSSF